MRRVQETERRVNIKRNLFLLRETSAIAPSGGLKNAAITMETLTANPQIQFCPPATWLEKYLEKTTVTMITEKEVLAKSNRVQTKILLFSFFTGCSRIKLF